MRSIIIYYSHSGNTAKVAEILAEHIKQNGSAELIKLEPINEPKAFFTQAVQAFKRTKTKIKPIKIDLSEYALICLGTPVWAFAPAPAMNKYLNECRGIQDKDVILFVTYGSGLGVRRCLNIMEKEVRNKGAKKIFRFSIQESKVDKQSLVSEVIKGALKKKGVKK
ncbi:MAG: NAD(P)H-dependent oxidoreductase [Candidatus Omnitrophica bacterium]|nr:NAD(P)H-dependent oxidoreductase [Candidatus Omnitrophota bacterium]